MNPLFVRRSLTFTSAALLSASVACGGDRPGAEKLEKLKPGMTLDEVLQQMGPGPLTASGADTARVIGGYRRQRFLIGAQIYEVLYARDEVGNVIEPVLQAKEAPILFIEGKMVGSGWRFYVDEAMGKYHLPTPLRARDTMTVKTPDSVNAADTVKGPAK